MMKDLLNKTLILTLILLLLSIGINCKLTSDDYPTMPLEDIFDWSQEET